MVSINNDDTKLQCIHNQRACFANWTHRPSAIEECDRCGMKSYHGYLYKCYGCETLYCMVCIPEDPVFIFEYGDFIAIFCDVPCKKRYMDETHPELVDCDECHMMWPSLQYEKMCKECINGVCSKCRTRIQQGKYVHKHLDWEDPT